MKLLLDQGLPRSTLNFIEEEGISAIHVGDIGMALADDHLILEKAENDGMTVVTLDSDFHILMALGKAIKPSVIRIRIEGLKGKQLADLLQFVISKCDMEINKGALITVKDTGIRIHLLPVTK